MKTKEEIKKQQKEYHKNYRDNHKEEIKLKKKEYYYNPEVHQKYLEKQKQYRDTLDKKKVSKYNKMYRKEKLDPIKESIRLRENYQKYKIKKFEYQKREREKNPEKFRECIKKSRLKHPETYKEWLENSKKERRARYLAIRFVPLKESCEICGDEKDLQRHHWNYDKPLLVNTLCRQCHHIQHMKFFPREMEVPLCQ